ncbi:ABC transporter substrate-binding protein [Pigmentiphaga litoralis]|uniref:NitT/TauT family transport system substrate-binding protein n=1 Tax=Pigmentiphaga litoralis TaxID=516702 RepID=A0A7Y9IYQ8_9BURK|nr:ABC transporter substrate-binding protein [Pigmentiphaga litoralis]NYE26344.1 NitT/TauT family transport system substrate-binding protein [Pigmentiphaga litoralis]NYE85464.1 NitT/TauT family transport system substrate-binding protein [Pigmentiphaga litoralis]
MTLPKQFLHILITSSFLSLVPTLTQGQTITVKLAAAQNSLGSLPLVIAEQKGFFAEEGLKVETIDFKGGAPAVQALAAGSVDACICAADHAVRLRSRGQGGLVLVALTEYHGYGLVTLASSPAKTLADLRSKPVGITSAGSLTDNTIRYFINEAGFHPDRDFQLIGVGTGGPMRAAIESGSVAAGMLTTPDVQAALASDGKFRLVQDYRRLQYPALDLVAVEKWTKANPETARKLVRAVVRAERLVQTDPAAVVAGVNQMFPALKPELRKVLAEEAPKLASPDGKMARGGYDLMVKMMKTGDLTLKAPTYESVTAGDFLPKD